MREAKERAVTVCQVLEATLADIRDEERNRSNHHNNNLFAAPPVPSFGNNGRVDLRIALYRQTTGPLQTSNPGRIFENTIIMSLPASGAAYVANPGDTHAYDVRTGELKWVFHSVPQKGEFGAARIFSSV